MLLPLPFQKLFHQIKPISKETCCSARCDAVKCAFMIRSLTKYANQKGKRRGVGGGGLGEAQEGEKKIGMKSIAY